jgi:hypothetical protein
MKCLKVKEDVDVCVSVKVQLIYHKPESEDIRQALARNELKLKVQNLGSRHEAEIVNEIKRQLLKEGI